MDSIVTWIQGFSSFQLCLIGEFAIVVWAIFSREQIREYAISFASFGVVPCLYFYHREGQATLPEIVLGLIALYVGWYYFSNASEYHEREVEAYEDAYELEVVKNNYRVVRERSRRIDEEAEKTIEHDHIRLNTDLGAAKRKQEAIQINREEQQLRRGVIEESKKTNLHPNDIYEVNRARALGQVQTEQKYEETIAVIQAGNILKTADVQVDKQLRKELLEALRERQTIIDGDDAPLVKEEAIAAWDASIARIKRQINEQQGDGLVLSGNGQEALGGGGGATDVRGFEEPGDEGPSEQVPAKKRGPGRPAGSSNKGGRKGKPPSHTRDDG